MAYLLPSVPRLDTYLPCSNDWLWPIPLQNLNSVACEGGMCQFCPAIKPWVKSSWPWLIVLLVLAQLFRGHDYIAVCLWGQCFTSSSSQLFSGQDHMPQNSAILTPWIEQQCFLIPCRLIQRPCSTVQPKCVNLSTSPESLGVFVKLTPLLSICSSEKC